MFASLDSSRRMGFHSSEMDHSSTHYECRIPTQKAAECKTELGLGSRSTQMGTLGRRVACFVGCVLCSGIAQSEHAHAELRTWTNSSGKFSVEAEYVATENEKVQLKKSDGKIVWIPLSRLSSNDRQLVKDLVLLQLEEDKFGELETTGNDRLEPSKADAEENFRKNSRMNYSIWEAGMADLRLEYRMRLKPPIIITVHDTQLGDLSFEIADREKKATKTFFGEDRFAKGITIQISKRSGSRKLREVKVNGKRIRRQTVSDRRRKHKEELKALEAFDYYVVYEGLEINKWGHEIRKPPMKVVIRRGSENIYEMSISDEHIAFNKHLKPHSIHSIQDRSSDKYVPQNATVYRTKDNKFHLAIDLVNVGWPKVKGIKMYPVSAGGIHDYGYEIRLAPTYPPTKKVWIAWDEVTGTEIPFRTEIPFSQSDARRRRQSVRNP